MRTFLLLFPMLFLVACAPKPKSLVHYFPLLPIQDTLEFAIAGDEEVVGVDTVPNDLFFNALPPEMIREIEYVADTAEAVVLARGRYPLDDRYEAYLADVRYVWFQHQSLLLFDRKEKRFTGRLTAAEWYGGEGGQILTGAWLLDTDGDGVRECVQRQASHSIRLEGEEVLESTGQYVSLWQVRGGLFVEMPVQDSLKWIKDYPLPDMWGD